MNNDTIFALSSGHGKSGVAVIRISGNNLSDFAEKLVGRFGVEPRHAYFVNLQDNSNELIDQCIITYFSAPRSFTGEDVIEIASHGAPAVIEKIFEFLSSNNMRMATPGEFSRRAFYNNKMDLADIDGLAALLDAQTDVQRKSALASMMGRDSKIYDAWRSQMIEIAAYSAAILDYDADDLPENIGQQVRERIKKLHNEIDNALTRYAAARAVRGGFNIVLCGEPNVGKSSLFNAILGSNRAIVSDIPGTTRDVVSANLDIDGYLVNLSDTAGLRKKTTDKIEKIGIEKTQNEIENADLIIRVYAEKPGTAKIAANEIVVINKSDLLKSKRAKNVIYVSAKTGDGMDDLLDAIRKRLHKLTDGMENALVINARTKTLLETAHDELKSAMKIRGDNFDLIAEHVRASADAIGKILGTITATDVLDATFSQLCLGK
ncbi:MAG: tRNA uridine-5-carboxymethylaminomethyl(34) synthesis GTPase MnmE [Alphaproteobacteria bacterium]|nr:tRNA uridine-5-carboxymethylaminomethyl(34) synthesis GTPase MnmE [Alphaproteobacteria bacterium]